MRRAVSIAMSPIVSLIVSLIVAASACTDAERGVAPPTTGAVEANATVEWIVDGDTIDVVVDGRQERVRLIGIDTPEVAHAASGARPAQAAECFGSEAQRFTSGLIPAGTPVRLERDVVARDDFGRLLAYVYRAADGILVNYELARQGYAQPLTIPPNVAFREQIVEAARRAEADQAGLWAACS